MTSATLPPRPAPTEQALPSCPYVGLVPFSEHDAAFFFGRENETELIAANLVAARLTLLYAPSGVGKTSVLRAGVVPRLHEIGTGDEDVGIRSAAVAYVSDWSGPPLEVVAEEIRRALLQTGVQVEPLSPWAGLVPWLRGTLAEASVPAVYLVLDQFEEYFLYHPADEELPTAIGDVLTARGLNVHLLLSLREDALASLDRFEGRVPHLFENYLRLSYLDRDSARTAIEGPLARYNGLIAPDTRMSAEPELVDTVLDEVRAGNVVLVPDAAIADGPGPSDRSDIEAPYLQMVLTRLWDEERARGSSVLRRDTLRELGGAQTIVQTHLDTVMADLAPEQRDVAAEVFHHLVTTSGSKIALTAEDLADWAEIPVDRVRDLLERLSSGPRRILRPVPPAAGVIGPPRYEVFHDVMGAAVLDWRRRYASAQQQAEAEVKLQQARAAARTARRHLRRARLVAAVMTLLLVAACVLGVLAYTNSERAHSALRLAWARELAGHADWVVGTRPDTAILLGLQSLSLAGDPEGDPPTGLVTGLAETTRPSRRLTGHEQRLFHATFSPDGALVATASADHTARLWDTATGHPHGSLLEGHTDAVNAVAFSPDGALLATASADGTVRLWDTGTGRPHGPPLEGHVGPVWGVGFSPDGGVLATLDEQTLHLWDVASGQPHGVPLSGHTGTVWDAAFGPDGSLLATVGDDSTVRLWDLATGQPHGSPLMGHTGPVYGVGFSPDGAVLATSGADTTVRLWDVGTGQPLGEPLTGHTDTVSSVAFSPDGELLATAGADTTVRLWDTATGRPHGSPLEGHTTWVKRVSFSPDGSSLASFDAEAVRLWDPATGQLRGAPLGGHRGGVSGMEFSPDGTLLLTISADSAARLWDVSETPSVSRSLNGHAGSVYGVAFSPDEALLATASSDGTVRLWDVATGQPQGAP
ncbi:WD40 repeat, partial [Geodermatophilus obscurus]